MLEEMSSPSLISQNPGEILIFGTFLAKYSIWSVLYWKLGISRFGNVYDVILTSYVVCTVKYVKSKEEFHSFTMVPSKLASAGVSSGTPVFLLALHLKLDQKDLKCNQRALLESSDTHWVRLLSLNIAYLWMLPPLF